MLLLLRGDISKPRKKEIRSILAYLSEVDDINVSRRDWQMTFDRANQSYQLIIGICKLVHEGLLMTQENGAKKLREFIDDQQMHKLYEKFILEYYRKEHPELSSSASQIPWALDIPNAVMLPIMQTDITISNDTDVLIIDAKYYGHTLQRKSDHSSGTIHSGNLYQIFTYVKNKALAEPDKRVSGMLLYAKTDEAVQPSERYEMSGNAIIVQTLDLSQDFASIRAQLDEIVKSML